MLFSPTHTSRDVDSSKGVTRPPGDATTPHATNPPVPKPRTQLLLYDLTDSRTSTTATSDAAFTSSPLSRNRSTSFSEKSVKSQTPPTPQPRPRSAEQKKLQAQWELEKQQLQQKVAEVESRASDLEMALKQAKEKISELRNRDLPNQPVVDVEASLREKDIALQLAVEQSLKLQTVVKEKETALREKESLLQRRDSRIVGLEEEMLTLKEPMRGDPKKRLELRLSEAIGKCRQLEEELQKVKMDVCIVFGGM